MIFIKEVTHGKFHCVEMFSFAEEFLTTCGKAIILKDSIHNNPMITDNRTIELKEICETCTTLKITNQTMISKEGLILDTPRIKT